MTGLHERAARILELQARYARYGIGPSDCDDAWELNNQASNLIRELLAENERLRSTQYVAGFKAAIQTQIEVVQACTDAIEARDAGPSPFQGRTTRRE